MLLACRHSKTRSDNRFAFDLTKGLGREEMMWKKMRTQEDIQTSPLGQKMWQKIELFHTPIQEGRKKKCSSRVKRVGMVLKALAGKCSSGWLASCHLRLNHSPLYLLYLLSVSPYLLFVFLPVRLLAFSKFTCSLIQLCSELDFGTLSEVCRPSLPAVEKIG